MIIKSKILFFLLALKRNLAPIRHKDEYVGESAIIRNVGIFFAVGYTVDGMTQ